MFCHGIHLKRFEHVWKDFYNPSKEGFIQAISISLIKSLPIESCNRIADIIILRFTLRFAVIKKCAYNEIAHKQITLHNYHIQIKQKNKRIFYVAIYSNMWCCRWTLNARNNNLDFSERMQKNGFVAISNGHIRIRFWNSRLFIRFVEILKEKKVQTKQSLLVYFD